MASKESKKHKKERETVKKTTTRQTANPLSLETRLKVIAEYEEKKTPFRDLAKDYKVSSSQIQRTLAKKSQYLKMADSSRAGNTLGSPTDGVDFISRMLLVRDLSEDSPNVVENENKHVRLTPNKGDSDESDNDSRSTPQKPDDKNNGNFDDKSSNQSEYATSVSSKFSEDSIYDFKMESTDNVQNKKQDSRLMSNKGDPNNDSRLFESTNIRRRKHRKF